jgi:hypothetical protein
MATPFRFHLFPLLPTELRRLIITHALHATPPTTYLSVTFSYSEGELVVPEIHTTFLLPSLSSVCREFHDEVHWLLSLSPLPHIPILHPSLSTLSAIGTPYTPLSPRTGRGRCGEEGGGGSVDGEDGSMDSDFESNIGSEDEEEGRKDGDEGDRKPYAEGRISRYEGQSEVQWTHWWNEKSAEREREELLWELENGRRWEPWVERKRTAVARLYSDVPRVEKRRSGKRRLYSDVLRGN